MIDKGRLLIKLTCFLRSPSNYTPHLNPMVVVIERLVTLIDQCLNYQCFKLNILLICQNSTLSTKQKEK